LPFRVRIVDGAGSMLKLIGIDGVLETCAVDAADWQTDWTAPPNTTGYVRAQLVDDGGKVRTVTNPIYISDSLK
jgi:hypothetical protein